MSTYAWIVFALAVVLAGIVAAFYLYMRSSPPLDRPTRTWIAICLSGFVFQAFLFYDGAIFYLQLAALAAIYTLVLVPLKRDGDTPSIESTDRSSMKA